LLGNLRQQPGSTATEREADTEVSQPRSLRQVLLWRCDPQMLHWSGRALAQAGWGLGKLGARPNVAWKQVCEQLGWREEQETTGTGTVCQSASRCLLEAFVWASHSSSLDTWGSSSILRVGQPAATQLLYCSSLAACTCQPCRPSWLPLAPSWPR
jgi:hypothetical protein